MTRLGHLATEGARAERAEIDRLDTAELVRLMNEDDHGVPAAVAAAGPAIAAAIDAIVARGGRLIYVGAGTPGRIGVLDASECGPTFNTDRVLGIIAGGAVSEAIERAEDDYDAGASDLPELTAADTVVGISASGRTPYVLGAVAAARAAGALTVGLSCNAGAELSAAVDVPIEVLVGPEFIAGSTRLKAGTAQKLVLNMLSTLTMVRRGQDLRQPDGRRPRDQREAARPGHADRRAGQRREPRGGGGRAGRGGRRGQGRDRDAAPGGRRRSGPRAGRRGERPPAGGARRMRVVGLMSGTSADGIDAAVADFSREDEVLTLRPLGSVRGEGVDVAARTVEDVCRLDALVGQAFAALAAEAIEAFGPVDLIASHGQTLWHWVEDGVVKGTLQVGNPAWIAERTGVAVVSDFRSRDVAAGGQGAPLVSLLDTLLLEPGQGALNLGGIANLTADGVAFDVGPANALLDAVTQHFTGAPYDTDGALAASGTVIPELLERLLQDPYYARPAPKSTGKEHFNLAYLGELSRPR